MPAISGKEKSIVHSMVKPNWAPTCEYVAIPLGSSSEAPVTTPGPSLPKPCTNSATHEPEACAFATVAGVGSAPRPSKGAVRSFIAFGPLLGVSSACGGRIVILEEICRVAEYGDRSGASEPILRKSSTQEANC